VSVSLAIDHFGWFSVSLHALTSGRAIVALMMVARIVAISNF
jgi:uncharacterized membrane protein YdcZ (DUF606 family)